MSTPERMSDYVARSTTAHVLLSNSSTRFKQITDGDVGAINREFDNVHTIKINPEKPGLAQEQIAETVHAGDSFFAATGDGGDSLTINTFLNLAGVDEELRTVPVVSLRGGNANQGPAQLNPRKKSLFAPSVLEIIAKGQIVDLFPGRVKVEETEGEDQNAGLWTPSTDELEIIEGKESVEQIPFQPLDRLMAYFTGLGLVGLSMEELDKIRDEIVDRNIAYRSLREVRPALRGVRLSKHRPMSVAERITDSEGNILHSTDRQVAHEAGALEGDRIAKYFRAEDSDLFKDGFFSFLLTDARWIPFFRSSLKMVKASYGGHNVSSGQSLEVDFTTLVDGLDYHGHVDGQTFSLPKNGTMTVTQHDTPYRAVTTSPKVL